VDLALNLSGTRLRGRTINVKPKRTNIAGMSKTTQGERKMDLINQMMMQYSSQVGGYRGKPRGRGR